MGRPPPTSHPSITETSANQTPTPSSLSAHFTYIFIFILIIIYPELCLPSHSIVILIHLPPPPFLQVHFLLVFMCCITTYSSRVQINPHKRGSDRMRSKKNGTLGSKDKRGGEKMRDKQDVLQFPGGERGRITRDHTETDRQRLMETQAQT